MACGCHCRIPPVVHIGNGHTHWTLAGCVLWCLVTRLPTVDFASLRRETLTPSAGLPVLLCLSGAVGTLWADVGWAESFAGLESFGKLLAIPLLLAHFRRSARATWVLSAFLFSCTVLLAISFYLAFWPGLDWRGRPDNFAVPVKDYIAQGGEFVICAFALLPIALGLIPRRSWIALGVLALAMCFLANVLYVTSGRTAWVVAAALVVVFALRQFKYRNAPIALVLTILCGWLVWQTSPFLRDQINSIYKEFHSYENDNAATRIGLRLEFWKKSISFIREHPLFGHGTGSTKELFRRAAFGEGASAAVTANPHNQTLAIATQLGLIGVGFLYAMWLAHCLMFCKRGLVAWLGLVIVVQNVVSCLFNSQLFDSLKVGCTYSGLASLEVCYHVSKES